MANPDHYNFAHVIKPIYYCSRLFGFMPFTIVYDGNGKILEPKIRFIDILWFLVVIGLYILSIISNFQTMDFLKQSSFILIGGDYVILKLGLAFSISVIVIDLCNRKKLIEIFKNFESFDENVSHFSNEIFKWRRSFSNNYLIFQNAGCWCGN